MNKYLIGLRQFHKTKQVFSQESAKDVAVGKQKNDKLQAEFSKIKLLDKEKVRLFRPLNAPINLNYPNPKGVQGYDERDFPVKELISDIPTVLKQEASLLKKEILESGSVEKPELLEDIGLLRHNEARIEFKFDNDEALKKWHTGCDSDWNEGYSSVELSQSSRGTCIFSGAISTQVIKDGRIERAGWASMKLTDRRAFNRKKYLRHWNNFSHLLIKCRGDGRSYKVMLHAPLTIDYTWGDSFSYPLHTHGGPYWQYEKIPFSKFFHTVNGRIQDRQYRVNLEDVSSLGIVLMDRIDGKFRLEIDYIGVCNDRSHVEDFAYETYTLPVYSTHGF